MKYKALAIEVGKDSTIEIPDSMSIIGVVSGCAGWSVICLQPIEEKPREEEAVESPPSPD